MKCILSTIIHARLVPYIVDRDAEGLSPADIEAVDEWRSAIGLTGAETFEAGPEYAGMIRLAIYSDDPDAPAVPKYFGVKDARGWANCMVCENEGLTILEAVKRMAKRAGPADQPVLNELLKEIQQ